jgi:hypothetical protein
VKTVQRLMAFAVVALAAFSSGADARDFKVMSGAACQPRSVDDRQDILVLVDGVTNINPTDPAFVVCPILRDNTSANPDGRLEVSLRLLRSSNDEAVSCLLDSRDRFGERLDHAEGSAGNGLTLTVAQNPDSRGGYYVVQCKLPPGNPGGTVIAYRYVEASPTDNSN